MWKKPMPLAPTILWMVYTTRKDCHHIKSRVNQFENVIFSWDDDGIGVAL